MSEVKFEAEDFVIEEQEGIGNKVVMKEGVDPAKFVGQMATDRRGEQLSVEQMRELQNRIMKRPRDFESWPQTKKTEYLLNELQNYYLNQLPPIDEMKKQSDAIVREVSIDDDTNIKGVKAPRINIKSKQVALTLISDGKTITFNNQEALDAYREAIKRKNKEASVTGGLIDAGRGNKSVVDSNYGQELHKGREWE